MGNITGASRNRHQARKLAALLAIAAAATMAALVLTNPVTAPAAPGDSSGGDASQPVDEPTTTDQPIPITPLPPIQGTPLPSDLTVKPPRTPQNP
jgi:hypothetical protein